MACETRWDFVRPHVQGVSVLDIGPAELVGTVNRYKFDRWIHKRITEVAKRVVGLEVNQEQVQALRDMGYSIVLGDAEDFALAERFDVILAGELIEHLSNPGKFLDCAWRHLKPGGKLLLTTPNRYGVLALFSVIQSGKVPTYRKPIAKHVAYFDGDALTSLLSRHGFTDTYIDYCKWVGAPSPSRRDRFLTDITSRYRPVLLPVLLAVTHKADLAATNDELYTAVDLEV